MTRRRGARTAEMPRDPAAVLRGLRECRDMLIDRISKETKPFGTTYTHAYEITKAIGVLADHLTGVRDYFAIGGSSANEGRLAEDAWLRAREKGDIPWDR